MKTFITLLTLSTILACSVHKMTITGATFTKANMDTKVQPCDNFYRYANGGWMAVNPVPPTESRWSSFNVLTKENEKKLQSIVDEVLQGQYKKGSNEQLIADFYRSASNMEARNKNGFKALESVLASIQKSNKTDLIAFLPNLMRMGVSSPFSIYVTRDRKNSTQHIVGISQSGLSLPNRDYYLKTDEKFVQIRQSYVEHIQKIFALSGFTLAPGEQILQFETEIAKAQWSITEQRDPVKTYNKVSVSDASNAYPMLQLAASMKAVGLGAATELIVTQPSYFEKLETILSQTSDETFRNYMLWHLLNNFSGAAGEEMEKENFRFYSTVLRGTREMKPLSERALNSVNGMLGEPLGKLFVQKYFPPQAKAYISEMIENLRSAYKESIMNLSWMGDTTKQKALAKLSSFTYKVGYPEVWKDYSSVDISPDNYIQNILNIRKFSHQLMIDKFGKPVDKKEWGMTPQTVNAYYNPTGNEIVFPAGILQPPFFSLMADDAMNYGGIGGVIGHEFTHGFDDQGSKYDGEGNLNNWWTESDRNAFSALTKKLGEQYSNYEPLPGMHINGEMTMGENIADLGGVTLAYAALMKKLEGKKPVLIDGFTQQQRFFLGWANVWKQNINEDELKNRLITDVHSPGEYRVLGPLSNVPAFHQAFACPDGSAMKKPENQVIKIW